MANMYQPVTGVALTEESVEVIWEIRQYPYVQQFQHLIQKQSTEFQFGRRSTIWTKWRSQLNTSAGKLRFSLKLLDQCGSNSHLHVTSTLENSKCSDRKTFQLLSTDERILYLNGDKDIHHFLEWKVTDEPRFAKCYCNIKGTLFLKITLKISTTKDLPTSFNIQGSLCNLRGIRIDRLYGGLSSLKYNTDTTDLKIICSDGKTVTAHHTFLSVSSPVFEELLKPVEKGKYPDSIKFNDISESTMKFIVHFLYTGVLSPGWNDKKNIEAVVYAAGKFELIDLLYYLDHTLGTEHIPFCNIKLLKLANKFKLSNAEKRYTSNILNMVSKVKFGDELIALLADNEEK